MSILMRCLTVLMGFMLATNVSHAQSYPSKVVRIVVPFAPGGPTDVLARMIAQKLSESMGQPFIVENRTGATGTIASGMVAKSPPDGYTLLMASMSSHISPYLYRNVGYDPTDFTPIVNVATLPFYFVAHPSVPANTLGELIALAKKRPGELNYASPGSGSGGHLCMEMFKAATGTDIAHVPYKGAAPAVADLVAGQVNVICDSVATSHPHVKAGKLRGLALAAPKRYAAAPEIPTTAEAGLPNFEISLWFGLLGPTGMPPAITRRLNSEVNTIMSAPDMRERIVTMGGEFTPNTPEEFAAFLKTDTPKWVKVIRDVGARID